MIAGIGHAPKLTDDDAERILFAAGLVTLARTAVEFDYRGDVIDAHAPEMPTRFAKQLAQIVRGAVAIGLDRERAPRLAIRCARDSVPAAGDHRQLGRAPGQHNDRSAQAS